MFGAQYFGQLEFAGVAIDLGVSDGDSGVLPTTGGGGWSHRGPAKLPQRKSPEFKPPVFKKPNPYRW